MLCVLGYSTTDHIIVSICNKDIIARAGKILGNIAYMRTALFASFDLPTLQILSRLYDTTFSVSPNLADDGDWLNSPTGPRALLILACRYTEVVLINEIAKLLSNGHSWVSCSVDSRKYLTWNFNILFTKQPSFRIPKYGGWETLYQCISMSPKGLFRRHSTST